MEGGSASALAGVLSPEFKTGKQRKIIVVISGRNIAKERFLEAISGVGGK
jgi:threonine dehydratase